MSPRRKAARRGPPTLGQRLRKLRISKGLTQSDAGALVSRSQAYVSLLEQDAGQREDQHALLGALKRAPSQARSPGGTQKAGRALSKPNGLVDPKTFRGEPLEADFRKYAATLSEQWTILFICRTAATTELGFLYREEHDAFGLVGFHLINGELKRGRVIAIADGYSEAVDNALEAFATGDFLDTSEDLNDDAFIEQDDGLLAEDHD